ncbi:LysR family transcriptional regulator [Streptomyces caniferus]|uniref:LysR family transcriptional regulator n=1 Tax=Streptomyces caniferus TaxID=285557 RepID=UPI0033E16C84
MNDLGQDLELRRVRYFTVVAAHQHFGRAAADLHVAQPALSRQIQRFEKYLGARLLDRGPQGTLLTPAGQKFLPRAQALLQAARQAELAVRERAETERITIGYVEDLVITAAVRELRRRYPDAEIATRYLSCRDVGALSEKRVDALIARAPLPLAADDVFTTPLYEEPRMLVVPRGHRLADRASVTAEELAGEAAATVRVKGYEPEAAAGMASPTLVSDLPRSTYQGNETHRQHTPPGRPVQPLGGSP